MLTIRLQRKGRKNQPFFKILVTEEKKSSTGGRFVEELGFYNPLTKERSLNKERATYWISVGAKPSDTMYNMLLAEGVLEGTKIPKHKKSKKKQPEAGATPQPTAEQTPAKTPTETLQETPVQEPVTTEEAAPEQPKEESPAPEPTPEEPKKENTPNS